MHEANLLGEYILNETGKIYAGNSKRISPKPWAFGQVIHFIYLFVFYFIALVGRLSQGYGCIGYIGYNIIYNVMKHKQCTIVHFSFLNIIININDDVDDHDDDDDNDDDDDGGYNDDDDDKEDDDDVMMMMVVVTI